MFSLLQRVRERCLDELEGLPLDAGRLGQHWHGDFGVGEADLVAGQGGQVVRQAAEAMVGPSGRVVLTGGLGLCRLTRAPDNYYDATCGQIAATPDPQEPVWFAVCDQSYVPPLESAI